ncbi:MAG: PQQ-binding-like beta-propeller repeat protein [Verrucomicrobia bacterium]|nr:PQQ-binding-like beta-propeller repeat protein [Verrucomicrobiota bacterium]
MRRLVLTFSPLACLIMLALASAAAAPPAVSNVRAVQIAGTKNVEILYDVSDADGDALAIEIQVSGDAGQTYTIPATALSGHIGAGVAPGVNRRIVWNADADWNGQLVSNARVRINAFEQHSDSANFGSILWTYTTANPAGIYGISTPAIADDRSIYFTGSLTTYALNPDGTTRWQTTAGIRPSLAVDGTVYVGGYSFLHALNADGTERWRTPANQYFPAAVGADGTICAISASGIRALRPDGATIWESSVSKPARPVIGQDGTLYTLSGDTDSTLLAIGRNGDRKWGVLVGSSATDRVGESKGSRAFQTTLFMSKAATAQAPLPHSKTWRKI